MSLSYCRNNRRVSSRTVQVAHRSFHVCTAGLRKTGERTVLGRRALVLEGRIEGVPTRLWWLPEAQLPARLERGRGKGLVRFSLRELHAGAPAGWPRMDEARLSGFGLIDAADFGDMQYDPFVQKLMQQDGDAHGHNHAH